MFSLILIFLASLFLVAFLGFSHNRTLRYFSGNERERNPVDLFIISITSWLQVSETAARENQFDTYFSQENLIAILGISSFSFSISIEKQEKIWKSKRSKSERILKMAPKDIDNLIKQMYQKWINNVYRNQFRSSNRKKEVVVHPSHILDFRENRNPWFLLLQINAQYNVGKLVSYIFQQN